MPIGRHRYDIDAASAFNNSADISAYQQQIAIEQHQHQQQHLLGYPQDVAPTAHPDGQFHNLSTVSAPPEPPVTHQYFGHHDPVPQPQQPRVETDWWREQQMQQQQAQLSQLQNQSGFREAVPLAQLRAANSSHAALREDCAFDTTATYVHPQPQLHREQVPAVNNPVPGQQPQQQTRVTAADLSGVSEVPFLSRPPSAATTMPGQPTDSRPLKWFETPVQAGNQAPTHPASGIPRPSTTGTAQPAAVPRPLDSTAAAAAAADPSALGVLTAVQVQVGMLLDNQQRTITSALDDFRADVQRSLSGFDRRLTAVEDACRRMEGAVADDLSAAQRERSRLTDRLEAMGMEREALIRKAAAVPNPSVGPRSPPEGTPSVLLRRLMKTVTPAGSPEAVAAGKAPAPKPAWRNTGSAGGGGGATFAKVGDVSPANVSTSGAAAPIISPAVPTIESAAAALPLEPPSASAASSAVPAKAPIAAPPPVSAAKTPPQPILTTSAPNPSPARTAAPQAKPAPRADQPIPFYGKSQPQ